MERDDWNAMWSGQHEHQHHHGEAPDPLLVKTVADLPTGRALDLGCGMGNNAIWLASQGWQVRAVDFADVALKSAASRATDAGVEVEFVVDDLRSYQDPQAYDLVSLFYIHMPPKESRQILARASQLLAPGGRLLFVGHDRSDLSKVEDFLSARSQPEHGHGHHHGNHHGHQGERPPAPAASDADRAAVEAMLSTPDEIVAGLAGLEIERAEVVANDAHCADENAPTTWVIARRSSQ